MKNLIPLLLLYLFCFNCSKSNQPKPKDFITVFETSQGQETATYLETIDFYERLEASFPEISVKTFGNTDSGYPLHLITYNPKGTGDDYPELRKTNRILFINNGIHPGESDGIDATMLLIRDLVFGKMRSPSNCIIATIPIYNIGGSLNRNSTTRTNQNGPKSYGFRGNARNYDLNRDFIKSDTRNMFAFAEIFHEVQPDMFIDCHVSNGADYQYTLTHLFSQHNKLGGKLGRYLHDSVMPKLESKLKEKNWDITPYVNVFNRSPENGFSQFFDSPRYSTGYAALFNCLGLMVETHMLKPYKKRVDGTYALLQSMVNLLEENGKTIRTLRKENHKNWIRNDSYPIQWELDTSKTSTLQFKGYEVKNSVSTVTGSNRIKFDTMLPYTRPITYYNYFKPKLEVTIPKAYVIPQGWHGVIELLESNNVEFNTIKSDTIIKVESYKIEDYKTRSNPYEGHYPHYNTVVASEDIEVTFKKGDIVVNTDQYAMRYLIETLEPSATDSFFNWNFFDTILQQKEGFSPYVWEDKAKMLLASNPQLQSAFELKKNNEAKFASNWYAQLDWLHKQSANYETSHLRYPIYRIK